MNTAKKSLQKTGVVDEKSPSQFFIISEKALEEIKIINEYIANNRDSKVIENEFTLNDKLENLGTNLNKWVNICHKAIDQFVELYTQRSINVSIFFYLISPRIY